VQLIIYIHTFVITVLTQVHQPSKILHARMTSLHGLYDQDSRLWLRTSVTYPPAQARDTCKWLPNVQKSHVQYTPCNYAFTTYVVVNRMRIVEKKSFRIDKNVKLRSATLFSCLTRRENTRTNKQAKFMNDIMLMVTAAQSISSSLDRVSKTRYG